MKQLLALLVLAAATLPVAAQATASADPASDPVVHMTIHTVADHDAQLNAVVRAADGFVADSEFTAFFALAPEHDPERPVRIDLTEFASAESLAAAMDDLAATESLAEIAMRPFDPADSYPVASLVDPGQILEVAVRDLTAYEDRDAFFDAIGAFVERLTAQPGVVREYQWLSLDGDTFVGMTIYQDMEAFGIVSQDSALLGSPEAAALFASYPPDIAQYLLLDPAE